MFFAADVIVVAAAAVHSAALLLRVGGWIASRGAREPLRPLVVAM